MIARERGIVHLVALGDTNQEIGKKLLVSVRTVDMYRARIVRSSSSKRQLRS
jgi:DNA-binding CsgD family transcriptional regulator